MENGFWIGLKGEHRARRIPGDVGRCAVLYLIMRERPELEVKYVGEWFEDSLRMLAEWKAKREGGK